MSTKVYDYTTPFESSDFAELDPTSKLDKLAKELSKVRETFAEYKKPEAALSYLDSCIWDLKQRIIAVLKEQKKTRHETARYIFSVRDIPKYFHINDEKELIEALKRKGLQRFIKKAEIVNLDDLKNYLIETKISRFPGLTCIENRQTAYVYPKLVSKKLEEDYNIYVENIKTFDPSKSTNKELSSEWRIICAWWATFHNPKKEIKFSKEEIVDAAKKIYDEIAKRVTEDKMKHEFSSKDMTQLSCELYCMVSGENPKICAEKSSEIFEEPKHSMAVIGSRTATPEMLEATAYQTKKALAGGWGVVTGGATGVDAEAIRTALKVLPKPTGGKMAFRVANVADFLDSKGEVFTSRPYNLPDAKVIVEGIGPCQRVRVGKATPELYTQYLDRSGFKSVEDWGGAKISPGKEHYIYRVEQLPKNKMLRVYLPKTINDQPSTVRTLLKTAKTSGFEIVENAGIDRAKVLFKGKPTYGAAAFARNKTIIDKSDAVVAVQKGTSKGTSHGITDALERGKAVKRIDENLNTTLMKKEKGKVTIKSLGKLGKGVRALGKLGKLLKVLPAVGFLTDAFDAAILWQELKTLDEAIKTGRATEDQKEIWKIIQRQRQAAMTGPEWKNIQTILARPSMPPELQGLKIASEDIEEIDNLENKETPESQVADVCTTDQDSDSVSDTDIMQESPLKLQKLPGIYLVEPHGRLIAIGDKVSIVKSKPFPNMTGKDLYLISDNLCWGIINLKPAEKITQDQFRRQKDSHKISMEEAEEWWDLAGQPEKELYDFRFEVKRIFAPPKPVKIPRGIQTFLKPESISFEKV